MNASSRPVALATLARDRSYEPGWIFERKLDGERCIATRRDGRTVLRSRSGRDVSVSFPELVELLDEQPCPDFAIDGEVVAFDGSRTSFSALQPRIHVTNPERARATGVRVYYYAFDMTRADGTDLRSRPLSERKQQLRDRIDFRGLLRYTPHRVHADEDYFGEICKRGWEGLIAKRADAPYPVGRTRDWLKFKCEAGQEFVVIGFTDPQRSRVALGALLLGYYDGDDLVYAGKVGTGFSDEVLRDLHRRLSSREVADSPCTRGKLPSVGVHWTSPALVAEVAFTEWTTAGQLRHPRYLGLRRDQKATDVVREG